MNTRFTLSCLLLCVALATNANAADWITSPADYTHDPATGQRVAQYAQVPPVYTQVAPNYIKSGYRNFRSTIQAGGSADNLHIVEEWGQPVVPYETWRNPYRPYGSPFPAWGPPLAGAGGGFFPGFGPIFGGGGGPGGGGGFPPGGGNFNGSPAYPYYQQNGPVQSTDGYWPTYDRNDRSDYYRPYR